MERANDLSLMALSSSPIVQNPPKDSPFVPNWFNLSVRKKRSIVPVTLPMGDMVRKFLGKTPKTKREKIKIVLNIDKNTGEWIGEVMKLATDKILDDVLPRDYTS